MDHLETTSSSPSQATQLKPHGEEMARPHQALAKLHICKKNKKKKQKQRITVILSH